MKAATCVFCGKVVKPGAADVLYAITGFEELRTQGGANMIHLRKRTGKYAHVNCVEDQKPTRRRIISPQMTLDDA